MLCHPGPCPPCPNMVNISCHCAKSAPVSRRCSNKYWSCNKTCNKLLKCKQHLCNQVCHPNECSACSKTSLQFCQCKKNRKQVLCTETVWHCKQVNLKLLYLKKNTPSNNQNFEFKKICSNLFSCGNHNCEVVCHSGECGNCPRSKIRSCPCGKSSIKFCFLTC